MYFMNDQPLQYLLDSVAPTNDKNVQTNKPTNTTSGGVNKPLNTTSGGVKPGVALPLKRKVEETGKQMVEKKPTDSSVYNVSTREKDVVAFDPNKKITDSPTVQTKKELIPGIPDTYTYIGGGVLAFGMLFMIFKD
jgi:hypothetical protein